MKKTTEDHSEDVRGMVKKTTEDLWEEAADSFNRLETFRNLAIQNERECAEPCVYQYRVKPTWRPSNEWQQWKDCSNGSYEDYSKTPEMNDWEYQTRKLFTFPPATQPCPECEDLRQELQTDRLLKTIRYLVGIAERGCSARLENFPELTAEAFVLGYVKGLEDDILKQAAELAKLKEVLAVCEKALSKAAKARIATLRNGDPDFEGYPYSNDRDVAKLDGYTLPILDALAAIKEIEK